MESQTQKVKVSTGVQAELNDSCCLENQDYREGIDREGQ